MLSLFLEHFQNVISAGFFMKNRLLIMLAMSAFFLPGVRAGAAATETQQIPIPPEGVAPRPAEPSPAAAELKDLVTRITDSMKDGKNRTEADQADHLKEFDTLLAKHKGETSDDVAEIAFMKATLYVRIFQQIDKGTAMLKQIQHDFPATKAARNVDQTLASIKAGEEAKKIQETLVQETLPVGTPFPDFDVKDLDGKPMSVAAYKGKVVMIDFWATWCPPCRAEAPNIAKTYQKYHDKGFEIIGISLDRKGDKDKLVAFTKENNMPWGQYYDEAGGPGKLAQKCAVDTIPRAFLLDGNGKIIAKGDAIRGEALEPAVKKALGASGVN
jgi:thiol-disulfide isomerase/thioredoxin